MARAAERTYEQLRDAVLAGRYPAGDRLGEVELAAALGVSRTPVREALRRLAAEGLVEIEPNRGARVTRWTDEDLDETYLLRGMLESFAATRAAERITPEVIGRLSALCDRMDRYAQPGRSRDLDRVAQLNNEFHALITETAAAPRLTAMLGQVIQVTLVLRTFHRYDEAALARSMGHHRELVEALRARDAAWAGAVMRSHVHAARGVLARDTGAARPTREDHAVLPD